MWDVFVSYKAEDRPRVVPFVKALERDGLSVWWDARIEGGEAWREAIAERLESARCVIVIWSKRSTMPEGRFVRDEASRAQQLGTYLPVTIDKVQPPLGFGEMQALSLTGWKGTSSDPRYLAVSACVHSMLGRSAPAPREGARAGLMTRRNAIAVGGAVAAALGAGAWLLLRPARAKANTIAVLPFANLSGDPSQEYFSDGMAEEVRGALAAIGGLEVVARTSSEMLRNSDAITAARRLNVANVITGSVRRSSSTVRVSAQLVDGSDGLERWSQTFDRPFGDVLKIQTDIAANVARALSIELAAHGGAIRSLGGTRDPEALDALLQATALEGDDSSESLLRRKALSEHAIQIDPNYAEAHARKALYQGVWAATWSANNAEQSSELAKAAQSAQRAIEISPSMALGYAALGIVYSNQLAMNRSLASLRRAVELPGADVMAFINYGIVLSRARRQAEAVTMIERAISLDPLNPVAWQNKTWILFDGRNYPQSIEAGRQTLSIAPQNRRARSLIGWDLLFLGRAEEAARELQDLPTDDYRRLVGEGAIAARSRQPQEALRTIELLRSNYGETIYFQVAEVYAQLRDSDKAIAALEAAWSGRDSGLAAIQVDPFLDPVRNDPRFQPIVKRVFG